MRRARFDNIYHSKDSTQNREKISRRAHGRLRECPLVIRVLSEIGVALSMSWVVLEVLMNDQNNPLLIYMIVGIGVIFVPIWLFAFLGTDLLSTTYTPQHRTCFNRSDIGWNLMIVAFFSITFRNLLLSLSFVFLGLLLRLSAVMQYRITHTSVPDDVRRKLNRRLIEKIERSRRHQKIHCGVKCNSSDSMYIVIDSLNQHTVDSMGYKWESAGLFFVSLTPEEIFTIAPMDEVLRMTYDEPMNALL